VAAVLTGVLLTIGNFLGLVAEIENLSEWVTKPSYAFIWLLYLLACVLLMVGLVGLYAYQSEAAGILGLVAFVGPFLGTVLVLGTVWASSSSLRSWRSELPEPSIPSPRDRWRRGSCYR
jgi:hypothetical protein